MVRINRIRTLTLIGAIILVVVTGWQVRVLAERMKSQFGEPGWVGLGDVLEPIEVRQHDIELYLDFRHIPRCSFVIFIEPTCPACDVIAPRWAIDFADVSSTHAMMISFSGWEDAHVFADRHELRMPLFVTGDQTAASMARRVGVLAVPTVLLLGDEGRIVAMEATNYNFVRMLREGACEPPQYLAPFEME